MTNDCTMRNVKQSIKIKSAVKEKLEREINREIKAPQTLRSQICAKTHRCMISRWQSVMQYTVMQYTFISLISFQRVLLNKHVLLTVLCDWQWFFLLFCSFFFFWHLKELFLANWGEQLALPLAVLLLRYHGVEKTWYPITLVFSCPEQEKGGQLLKYPFSYHRNRHQRVTSSYTSSFSSCYMWST